MVLEESKEERLAGEIETCSDLFDCHIRVSQHIFGVKYQQFTQPIWNRAAACLLDNL